MKLLAGMMLFLLCALAGEGKARRLLRREKALTGFYELIRSAGDRQLLTLIPFREALLSCPPSPEREQLTALLRGNKGEISLLTSEEVDRLAAYARSESRSLAALRAERDDLLTMLQGARDSMKEERMQKGQIYRSVGYLFGVAALLLVL